MITIQLPGDDYLRSLRALGAWWRLGSSAIEPRLVVAYASHAVRDPREFDLSGHGGVALLS